MCSQSPEYVKKEFRFKELAEGVKDVLGGIMKGMAEEKTPEKSDKMGKQSLTGFPDPGKLVPLCNKLLNDIKDIPD